MSLESQRNITVSIDWPGLGNLGTFDTKNGFEADSEETKYRPGNMGPEESLGGVQTTSNGTIARLFKRERDLPLIAALAAARGKASVTVSDQFLDRDGNAFGRPVVYTGIYKSFTAPDADSRSDDPAMLTIEISANSAIAA